MQQFAGTSMIGVELQKIIESTKALIKERPEIDPERVGMTGLSWVGENDSLFNLEEAWFAQAMCNLHL
jgi:hypothetical protein